MSKEPGMSQEEYEAGKRFMDTMGALMLGELVEEPIEIPYVELYGRIEPEEGAK